MVDHIRTLLLNREGVSGYRKVADDAADRTLSLIGIDGGDGDDGIVDAVLPVVLSPDLARFRRFYDPRTTPAAARSVYEADGSASLDGVVSRLLGQKGRFTSLSLFTTNNPSAYADLREMRRAAMSKDAPYAVGAVLLACAYRRHLLQTGGV